jgi:DNA-directed RNA polymerase subunit RPC12/RpoP
MATSQKRIQKSAEREQKIQCPYCLKNTPVVPAPDYQPIYANCNNCGKQFIVERIQDGIKTLQVEGAPCCDDPDRRAIETSLGDED